MLFLPLVMVRFCSAFAYTGVASLLVTFLRLILCLGTTFFMSAFGSRFPSASFRVAPCDLELVGLGVSTTCGGFSFACVFSSFSVGLPRTFSWLQGFVLCSL